MTKKNNNRFSLDLVFKVDPKKWYFHIIQTICGKLNQNISKFILIFFYLNIHFMLFTLFQLDLLCAWFTILLILLPNLVISDKPTIYKGTTVSADSWNLYQQELSFNLKVILKYIVIIKTKMNKQWKEFLSTA